MKIIVRMILTAVALFTAQLAPAQGTLYLSNLGQTPVGSAVVGSDAWIAQDFRTGTNSGGYTLNSIQLLLGAASGTPSGFSVSVYNSLGGSPGSNLGSLGGADPSAGGIFSYATSGITLSSSTFYFVVLTAATPAANGSYNWSFVNPSSYDSNDGWLMNHIYYTSTDGSTWPVFSRGHFFQLAVDASAIPEPAIYSLVGLGLVGLSFWRHKIGQAK
jgi:PEP-CTERM motif